MDEAIASMWDDNCREKRAKEQRALTYLRNLPWAAAIVKRAGRAKPDEGDLFELRFAYELALVGAEPVHGHKTGVGKSDVDFRLEGDPSWNIELFSLRESKAVAEATTSEQVAPRITMDRLYLHPVRTSEKATPGHELLRFLGRIETKLWDEDRQGPTKFPVPEGRSGNVLLVDMRSYVAPDRQDCRQLALGPKSMRPDYVLHVDGRPIPGLFDLENERPAARLAQERLHILGFVHEQSFRDIEIRKVAVWFANPRLNGKQLFLKSFPAREDADAEHCRRENDLWRNLR